MTKDINISESDRHELIRRASVFQGIEAPEVKTELEVKNGPFPEGATKGLDYFEWGDDVDCIFSDKNFDGPPGGLSPKFLCDIVDKNGVIIKKKVKIKYDPRNSEVYNEVAASRLFWLLGFPADNYHSV